MRWITRGPICFLPRFRPEVDHQSVTVGATANRIGAKFDEPMALRDELEEQLTTSQTESRRLLEAKLGMVTFRARVESRGGAVG